MSDAVCYIENGIVSTLYVVSIFAMLWFIYKYLKAMTSEKNKALKYLGLTLFCAQALFCIINGVASIVWTFVLDCAAGTEFMASIGIGVALTFGLQYLVMLFLLFYRLKVVFDGTAYELSRCTVWSYAIMYVSLIIIAISQSFINDAQVLALYALQ